MSEERLDPRTPLPVSGGKPDRPPAERPGSSPARAGGRLGRWLWPAILTAAVAAVYAPVLVLLFEDWVRDPNYSHGFLVPLISAYLVWKRRHDLARIPARPSAVGLVGVIGAVALLVVGAAGAEVFVQRVSLVVLIGSTVLFLRGWRWFKAILFPLAFLLLAIPMPYILYYGITGPLQSIAAKFAILGLQGIGVPAVAQGNIIHLPEVSLEVAEACSGIRSLYAFLALGALLAYSMSVPFLARVVVFLMTIPLSVAANAVRVWATGLGAYTVGPEVTHGTIHEMFGLLVFAVAIGLFLLVRKGARSLWSSG